ncbi:MAG TPA: hypothetical protein VK837_07765 [Longimicrobiales bacterium]|nr:hypothetical protein [Longimicrobiales bacterium]
MSGAAVDGRDRKFRQAAIVYLHVGVLYEAGIVALWRAGLMPDRGPVGLWLLFGALIVGGVTWALWRYRSPWLPRVVWALHALRLPAVLAGAFGLNAATTLPAELWRLALVVVLVNLGFLARAGWDL